MPLLQFILINLYKLNIRSSCLFLFKDIYFNNKLIFKDKLIL